MKTFIVLTRVSVLILCLLIIGCHRGISDAKAKEVAAPKLHEYCESQGVAATSFGEPKITSDEKYPWIMDYASVANPRHLVRIYVSANGDTQLHRMMEDATSE